MNREYDPSTFAQPEFHNVIVPIGEASVPSVEELAEKCLAGVEIMVHDAEDDACAELEKAHAKELYELTGKPTAIRKLKATHKQQMKACKAKARETLKARKHALKAVVDGAKRCYMSQKKLYTVKNKTSQLTALETCFGKPLRRPFTNRPEFVKHVTRRVSGRKKSKQLSITSFMATR